VVVHRNDESEFIDLTARAERVLLVDVNGDPVGASAGTMISDPIDDDTVAATVRSLDAESLIAEGQFLDRFLVNKFGRNPDIQTGSVPEEIWGVGGAYTGFPQGAAEAVRVTSTSAADAAAGTGARSVFVEGLDASWNRQSEVIATSGLTPAVSANLYRRVNRAYALGVGSGGVNAGDLTVQHNVTTANIFARILAGFGQSKQAVYTIPAGFTGYLRSLGASILGVTGTARFIEAALWTRTNGFSTRLRYPFAVSNQVGDSREFHGGIPFPAETDIAIRVTNASATVDVTGYFDIVCVRD
jgi:hypothetical protein